MRKNLCLHICGRLKFANPMSCNDGNPLKETTPFLISMPIHIYKFGSKTYLSPLSLLLLLIYQLTRVSQCQSGNLILPNTVLRRVNNATGAVQERGNMNAIYNYGEKASDDH